jgi:hypothetical protein
VFNVFNFQNFDPAGQLLRGSLCTAASAAAGGCGSGAINSTPVGSRTNLVTLGSGTYAYGAPRQAEFGAKISF